MDTIDKNHHEIRKRLMPGVVFVSLLNEKEIYFSSAAARKFDLKPGRKMIFENGGGKWSCYQTDDNNGFTIYVAGSKSTRSVRILSRSLVAMIRNRTNQKERASRFLILNSGNNINDEPVMELIFDKTIDQLAAI